MSRFLVPIVAIALFAVSCGDEPGAGDLLSENAAREGVEVTETGLQYEIVRYGTGRKPTLADNVKVHYEGKLVDGTVFDSSYQRGEPITFPLSRVVSGWKEGLQPMPVGSEYNLYVPAELGYGERAMGAIPSNSTLVFRVELLEIQ